MDYRPWCETPWSDICGQKCKIVIFDFDSSSFPARNFSESLYREQGCQLWVAKEQLLSLKRCKTVSPSNHFMTQFYYKLASRGSLPRWTHTPRRTITEALSFQKWCVLSNSSCPHHLFQLSTLKQSKMLIPKNKCQLQMSCMRMTSAFSKASVFACLLTLDNII